MIKTLRANHTKYHFKKEIFDKLPVDQMRWIFENRLADQEIPGLQLLHWFVGHDDDTRTVKSNGTVRPMTEQEKENERLNAYTFTEYSWFVGNYNDPAFYDKNQLTNEAIGIEQHGDEAGTIARSTRRAKRSAVDGSRSTALNTRIKTSPAKS